MSGLIYLRQSGGGLVPMTEQAYDTEDVLQALLADYPDLLAGEQINAASPRRWLLLKREAGLPSEEGGAARWSIDHLFLDQDGIPTIIEVKRSSNSQIRREVVGQMLDYAANAVVYWPVESLRAQFESKCESEGIDPEQRIAEALGFDGEIDQFWQTVKNNLQLGRVRMIFVADDIPPELRRIVEFLNGQMNPAEVLAVEVKQYVGQGQQAQVPRVIGQTQQAIEQKTSGAAMRQTTDEQSFFTALQTRRGVESSDIQIAQSLLTWSTDRSGGAEPGWGKDRFFPKPDPADKRSILFSVLQSGRIELNFGTLQSRLPFTQPSKRLELLVRLNAIPGIQLEEGQMTRYPSVQLSVLEENQSLEEFLSVFDWVIDEIKQQ